MPIVMNKKIGETPLQCLDRLRVEQPQFTKTFDKVGRDISIPLTYAGRLDPMADGVLLVLAGGECKDREKYLEMEKEYVCEILWGFETDTHDILGKLLKVEKNKSRSELLFDVEKILTMLQQFVGKRQQKFPAYSSKPVKGKPLHEWARAGRLDEIEIPSKEIEIRSIKLLETKRFRVAEIKQIIFDRLALVRGNFRQDEIISDWKQRFNEINKNAEVVISTIKVVCSSGTYIRGLAQELGGIVGVGSVVYKLTRIRVGGCCLPNL